MDTSPLKSGLCPYKGFIIELLSMGENIMFNNADIERQYKKASRSMIIGLIGLIVALALLAVSVGRTVYNVSKAEHLNDAIVAYYNDGELKKDRIAYLDTTGFYQVASYGDDLGYYIAYDDDYYYIISIKEKDWDYFADQFDDSEWVRLWGYTREIPEELKEYAIESLNEDYPDANLSVYGFDDIFGMLMLETGRDSSVKGLGGFFNLNGLLLGVAFLAGLFGLIYFLLGRSSKKSFKVLGDDQFGESPIMAEINAPEAKWYEGAKTYLTDNYLVSMRDGVNAVKYSDIFWMYVTNHRTNGIADYNFINIVTKDGKMVTTCNSPTFGKKRREATEILHNDIMQALKEKNSDILVGYTAENVEAFKQLQKENKEKKDTEL